MHAHVDKRREAGKGMASQRWGVGECLPGFDGRVDDGLFLLLLLLLRLLVEGRPVGVVAAPEALWADAATALAVDVKVEIAVCPGQRAGGARIPFATRKGMFQRLADGILARFERRRALLWRRRGARVQEGRLRHGRRAITP
jgi:hypothetical protein